MAILLECGGCSLGMPTEAAHGILWHDLRLGVICTRDTDMQPALESLIADAASGTIKPGLPFEIWRGPSKRKNPARPSGRRGKLTG